MTLKYLTEPVRYSEAVRGPPCHWDWVPMAPPNFRASLPGTDSVAGGAMWNHDDLYRVLWILTPCSWDVFGYIMIYYIYFICMVTPP